MAIIPDMRTSSPGKTRQAGADGRRGDFMTSLAKGLEILAAFEVGHPLGNQELVAITGLPKTTVSRITGTLASLGYLRLDEQSRKYSMGARVLGLGASVQRHIGLLRTARPHMQRLADELDIAVILGARDRTGLVFLEVIHPPRNALTINTDSGSVVPIERTSIGLAYLVAAPCPSACTCCRRCATRIPTTGRTYAAWSSGPTRIIASAASWCPSAAGAG